MNWICCNEYRFFTKNRYRKIYLSDFLFIILAKRKTIRKYLKKIHLQIKATNFSKKNNCKLLRVFFEGFFWSSRLFSRALWWLLIFFHLCVFLYEMSSKIKSLILLNKRHQIFFVKISFIRIFFTQLIKQSGNEIFRSFSFFLRW